MQPEICSLGDHNSLLEFVKAGSFYIELAMCLMKSLSPCIIFTLLLQNVSGEPPMFRILAPPFVCPKDSGAIIDKPDTTIITVQADAVSDLEFSWTVRWRPLAAPTQLFTLALWRAARALEANLNRPQPVPFVYVINNTDLLPGVDYVFNVTASRIEMSREEGSSPEGTIQGFHIDNIKGDAKLLMEGRAEMFAVMLVGGQEVYHDMEYVLEALVMACYQTQDYYFVWSVNAGDINDVDVSYIKGSRLEIPQYTLMAGVNYNALCQVFKYSGGEFITQASIPFKTLRREVTVELNVDILVVTINKPFTIQAYTNVDYSYIDITITWQCTFNGEPFLEWQDEGNKTISFSSGLPNLGEYAITVCASVEAHTTSEARARVITTAHLLPVLQIEPIRRVLNEGSHITLTAHVTDIYPECSIAWYYQCQEINSTRNSCDDEHGTLLSEPYTFNSLEENFLSELSDYTNDSATATLTAELQAAAGKVRLVAECECSRSYNCTTKGTVYADINFEMNSKPAAGEVLISPEAGTALQTVFRLSTLAHSDPDRPLRYSFYCKLESNETIMLGSYLEHLAVETMLPYSDGTTIVWVQICDSLGACADGMPRVVQVSPGDARTIDILVDDARAQVRRCEMMTLRRLIMIAVATYTNARQQDALIKFTTAVIEILGSIDKDCVAKYQDQYLLLVTWLEMTGVDTTNLQYPSYS